MSITEIKSKVSILNKSMDDYEKSINDMFGGVVCIKDVMAAMESKDNNNDIYLKIKANIDNKGIECKKIILHYNALKSYRDGLIDGAKIELEKMLKDL